MNSAQSMNETNIAAVLGQAGYTKPQKVANTLQGQIWRADAKQAGRSSIIKVASRELHQKSSIILNGKQYKVHENILLEGKIMKYLSSFTDCPPSIIGYDGFFKSKSNYYLLMENGGNGIFEFITKAHQLINMNKIDISEWKKFVKIVFKQLIQAIEYMHNKNTCHFDISLENITLLNDIKIQVQFPGTPRERITFSTDDIQIKVIDFGLAQIFSSQNDENIGEKNGKFVSSKFCGKANYQSPEIVNNTPFNAAANDIWCAGVCLFMMISGGGPWHRAHETDECFKFAMNGHIKPLLKSWNRLKYFDDDILDLITSIFKPEQQRITIAQIKEHKWLN